MYLVYIYIPVYKFIYGIRFKKKTMSMIISSLLEKDIRLHDVSTVSIDSKSALVEAHGKIIGLIIERHNLTTSCPRRTRIIITGVHSLASWIGP